MKVMPNNDNVAETYSSFPSNITRLWNEQLPSQVTLLSQNISVSQHDLKFYLTFEIINGKMCRFSTLITVFRFKRQHTGIQRRGICSYIRHLFEHPW
jgi:hypothetical protein